MSDEPRALTPALAKAIDELYRVFCGGRDAVIEPPRNSAHDMEEEIAEMTGTPVGQLSADQLGLFGAKAMTTWGGEDDYQNYLPRICELMLESATWHSLEFWMVADKLVYGAWRSWAPQRVAALEAFIAALWSDVLSRPPTQPLNSDDFLQGAVQLYADLSPFLRAWEGALSLPAALQLSHLHCSLHWLPDALALEPIVAWLEAPARLESLRLAQRRFADEPGGAELAQDLETIDANEPVARRVVVRAAKDALAGAFPRDFSLPEGAGPSTRQLHAVLAEAQRDAHPYHRVVARRSLERARTESPPAELLRCAQLFLGDEPLLPELDFGPPDDAEARRFEASLRANPGDDATWRVYADLLLERGRPLGEWMASHSARTRWHSLAAEVWPAAMPRHFTARHGFLESVTFWLNQDRPEELCAHPLARFLTSVELHAPAEALERIAGVPWPRALRRLSWKVYPYLDPPAAAALRGAWEQVLTRLRTDLPHFESTSAESLVTEEREAR